MSKKRFLKILDYLYITRPILFFPGWTTLLLGNLEARESINLFFVLGPSQNLILAFVSFGMAMGGTFILNQLADAKTDELNQKCFFIGKKMISKKSAYIQSIILIGLAIYSSFLINIHFCIGIIFFVILTGYLYNFAPFILKNKAVLGLISNILMGWIAFYLGWVLLKPFSYQFLIKSFSFFLLNASLCVFTTIPDIEGDKAVNKNTISVNWGINKSVYFAVFIFLIGFLWGVFIMDNLVIAIYIGGIFHYIKVALHPTKEKVISTTRWTLFIYSLVSAMFFPWYLSLIIIAYFLSKWYYKSRFNINYPSFS